jgi:vancomycin resistance protein YoaR
LNDPGASPPSETLIAPAHMRRSVVITALAVTAFLLASGAAPARLGVPYELVSRFTTYYPPGQPRVINIRRAAVLLDRTLLRPGARFSLNQMLGKRTRARGFVAAPSISGPIHVDSVGGGVSQVATTLYNAAFFAGLRLIEHTPHSFYISRYPKGREATISWGGPELVFQNDWQAPLLLRMKTTRTSITVWLYSYGLGRRVTTVTRAPTGYVRPRTVYIKDPTLPPGTQRLLQSAGASGFSISYTRRVYRDDSLRRDERYSWTYSPENTVIAIAGH